MEDKLSNEYYVLEYSSYNSNLQKIKRSLKEKLDPEEVLIKVQVTTIHPCDLFFSYGLYGNQQPQIFPVFPGFEGSGEIVQVGETLDSKLIGKKICLFQYSKTTGNYQGLWGEFTYAPLERILIFKDTVKYENIAFSVVNPLTVCGFLDTAKRSKVKAVIQNAAFSALGKMFIRLCAKEKMSKP